MSSSTSAKPSGHGPGSPKQEDKSPGPQDVDSKPASAEDPAASKDRSTLNGSGSDDPKQAEDRAGAAPGADAREDSKAGAHEATSAPNEGKKEAGEASKVTGDTSKEADTASTPDTPAADDETQAATDRAGDAKPTDAPKPAPEQDKPDTGDNAEPPASQTTKENTPKDNSGAGSEAGDEEDTLDLRALFTSPEPEFASPTDTFELARGAKSVERGTAEQRSSAPEDTGNHHEFPLDLPPVDVSADEGHAFMARGGSGAADTGSSASPEPDKFGANAKGDPLADAVQSALRSVYGDDSGAGDDDFRNDDATESAGPVLQWAGTGATDPSEERDPYLSAGADDTGVSDASDQDNAIDEETTEAVLSYLYEHMGSNDAQHTGGQAAGERPGLDERTNRSFEDDRSGYDEWLNSAMSSRPEVADAPVSSNYAGYRAAREAAPGYARAADGTADDLSPTPAGAADFAAPMDLSADSSEASGKLLGAAGLGLIGGIAVAGVAAVFVFNSFVTQQEPPATTQRTQARLSDDSAQSAPETVAALPSTSGKDDSRLGATSPITADTSAPTRTAAIASADDASTPRSDAAPEAAATPETTEAAPQPPISASRVTGRADQLIPLNLTAAQGDGASFVRIVGLPRDVKLSAGVDTGNGSWLLSAGRTNGLSLSVPDSYAGNFTLEAQLLASDARTPISEPVAFQVSVAPAPPQSDARTTTLAPETARAVADQPPGILDRARSLMRSGDVLAAREVLRPEAEDGNAKAALVLGQTFDPMTFTPDSPANAAPDATEAFRWYQKAVELGAPEGNKRIADLKNWLLQ